MTSKHHDLQIISPTQNTLSRKSQSASKTDRSKEASSIRSKTSVSQTARASYSRDHSNLTNFSNASSSSVVDRAKSVLSKLQIISPSQNQGNQNNNLFEQKMKDIQQEISKYSKENAKTLKLKQELIIKNKELQNQLDSFSQNDFMQPNENIKIMNFENEVQKFEKWKQQEIEKIEEQKKAFLRNHTINYEKSRDKVCKQIQDLQQQTQSLKEQLNNEKFSSASLSQKQQSKINQGLKENSEIQKLLNQLKIDNQKQQDNIQNLQRKIKFASQKNTSQDKRVSSYENQSSKEIQSFQKTQNCESIQQDKSIQSGRQKSESNKTLEIQQDVIQKKQQNKDLKISLEPSQKQQLGDFNNYYNATYPYNTNKNSRSKENKVQFRGYSSPQYTFVQSNKQNGKKQQSNQILAKQAKQVQSKQAQNKSDKESEESQSQHSKNQSQQVENDQDEEEIQQDNKQKIDQENKLEDQEINLIQQIKIKQSIQKEALQQQEDLAAQINYLQKIHQQQVKKVQMEKSKHQNEQNKQQSQKSEFNENLQNQPDQESLKQIQKPENKEKQQGGQKSDPSTSFEIINLNRYKTEIDIKERSQYLTSIQKYYSFEFEGIFNQQEGQIQNQQNQDFHKAHKLSENYHAQISSNNEDQMKKSQHSHVQEDYEKSQNEEQDEDSQESLIQRKYLKDQKIKTKHNQDGYVKQKTSDGYQLIRYPNGDIKQISPEGKSTYFFKESQATMIILQDGTKVIQFPNGQEEQHFPDGSKHIKYPDSTFKVVMENEEITQFPDGTIKRKDLINNVQILEYANGRKDYLFPDESVVQQYPNGIIKRIGKDKQIIVSFIDQQ